MNTQNNTTDTINTNEINTETGKKSFTIGNTAITFAWTREESMLVIAREGEIVFNSGVISTFCKDKYNTMAEWFAAMVEYIKTTFTDVVSKLKPTAEPVK